MRCVPRVCELPWGGGGQPRPRQRSGGTISGSTRGRSGSFRFFAIALWLPASAYRRSRVGVVQEFCQLLAQALVALAFVAEHDRALEQSVLQLVRQLAP